MNTVLILLLALFTQNSNPYEEVNSMEREKIELAISNWADSIFIKHEGDKYETHRAFYSDEYFIHTTRIEMYTEKINVIQQQKEKDEYPGSEEQYTNSLNKLEETIASARESLAKTDPIDHYESNFWSNLQTQDGITVYYEILINMNSKFEILSAKENSSIGKISFDSKIAYSKGDHPIKVIEK